MEDHDIVVVARKSVKGVAALTSRTFIVQILAIVANFILTVYLSPEHFGIFFLVSAFVVFLTYFQDIGLAASLIQKKTEPTETELRSVFTVQQLLVLAVVIPTFLLSGTIADFYRLDQSGLWLLQAFLVSFVLSSLRTVPTVLLERKLDFDKLVIPQIAENFVYNITLIIAVISGLGVHSFTIAVLLRGIVGLILIYVIQPWRIGFAFSMPAIRQLLSFGVPFQMNSILALIKDDLLNIYIAKVLPLSQVGYIGFAQKWAFLPLRLVMDNVIKVTFPSYSRLQDDRVALAKMIEKSLMLIAVVIFPVVVSVILLAPHFVDHFPQYHKWQPALTALTYFSLNALVASVTVPLTNFLNAIGKIKITLMFMVFWTVITWILTPLLITVQGYNGVGLASFIVAGSGLSVVFVVKRFITFSFLQPIKVPLFGAVIMVGSILALQSSIHSLVSLVAVGVCAWVVYSAVLYFTAKDEFQKTFAFIKQSVSKSL